MKALRAEGKPLREISETIEKDFHIVMAPMTDRYHAFSIGCFVARSPDYLHREAIVAATAALARRLRLSLRFIARSFWAAHTRHTAIRPRKG